MITYLKPYIRNQKNEGGFAMIISVLFFVVISTLIVFGLSGPTAREFRSANDSIRARQSYFLAESGAEDVYYRLKHSKTVDQAETLTLGDVSETTTTGSSNGMTTVLGSGNASNYIRNVGIIFTNDSIVNLPYVLETGIGGLDLRGISTRVTGDMYANGPVTGDSNAVFNGSVTSASSGALSTPASNSDTSVAYDIPLGTTASTHSVAQSFVITNAEPLSKVQLYVKKIGTPVNIGVTIVADTGGAPGSLVYASGTLSQTSVNSSYGWMDVVLSPTMVFAVGKTYWLVLTAGTSSSDYYLVAGTSNMYAYGDVLSGSSSTTWQAPNASPSDMFFKVVTGGFVGSIIGSSNNAGQPFRVGAGGVGDVRAHTVKYVNVAGTAYCVTSVGTNKTCTTTTDPITRSYSLDMSQVAQWESDASSGTTATGDFTIPGGGSSYTGNKVVTGNLTVNGPLTLGGTLWVKGNLIISSGGRLRLSSSYGAKSGVVIVSGTITVSGGGFATGSGTSGSYLVLVGLDPSSSAFSLSSGTGSSAVVYIPNGKATMVGGTFGQITAYQLAITSGANVTHSTDLNALDVITSMGGPAAYTITSWREQ